MGERNYFLFRECVSKRKFSFLKTKFDIFGKHDLLTERKLNIAKFSKLGSKKKRFNSLNSLDIQGEGQQ